LHNFGPQVITTMDRNFNALFPFMGSKHWGSTIELWRKIILNILLSKRRSKGGISFIEVHAFLPLN